MGAPGMRHVLPCAIVRAVASCALFTFLATAAHADPRDEFGFEPKLAPPLDCSAGREFGCAQATDPLADSVPFSLATWLPAAYLLSLPVGPATHDDVASYALGASRDDAGVHFGGNGLENRWTIEGAPADNIRTGAADTQIPLAFLDGILVTAGGFAARDRASTGGIIDARLKRGTKERVLDVRAWAGFRGKVRHAPETAQSYALRRVAIQPGAEAGATIVATGHLGSAAGVTAWYAAGIAPEFARTRFAFTAASLVDADRDGTADGLPGVVVTQPIESNAVTPVSWSVPAMVRLGVDRASHHLELTLIGTTGTSTRFAANSTLQAAGIDELTAVGDGIATWHSEWPSTRARIQAAWHRSVRRESARNAAAAGTPQLLSAYVPAVLDDDPVLARACDDGSASDPYPGLQNCPIATGWFASGGAGPLTDETGDRPSLSADIAHRFGSHVVRAGATGEDTRLVTRSHFTGDRQLLSLFPSQLSERHYLDRDASCSEDAGQNCGYAHESELRYRTRYVAAYLEDSWRAAADVSVNAGLRWELMWVGTALQFSNQLSPRLGWAWDPLGGGRSRVWTSMGRSFAMVPAGIGSTVLGRHPTATDTSFGDARVRTIDRGAPLAVTPGILPIEQDELAVGGQFAIARQFVLTGWLQGKWLRHGIESTSTGLDNPGRSDNSGGSGTAAGSAMPALRQTTALALELATAPTATLSLRAGYMYARTLGSWTGAFAPRTGAVLYNSGDFDARAVNQLGALPSDPGHRFYLEGVRTGQIGAVGLAIATRFTVGSGAPRDALGETADGVVYLIGRGSAGRGPLTTQANVRLAAQWRGFELALDVFNLFNRREATKLDPVYATGTIRPIEGGSTEDLVFLTTDAGQPAPRRPAYRTGTEFHSPIAAVLTLHHSF